MTIDATLLLRHMSDAVLGVDPAGRVTAANTRAETLLLRRSSELVGGTLADCLPDFGGSQAARQLGTVAAGTVERRVDHFSATRYTWFEIRAVPAGGGALVLFLRDVTDRVRLARSDAVREAVREIIMDAPVAISLMRGREHRYELVNEMARRLIGGRNVEGRTARSAFPEVDASLFDILDRVYATGERVELRDLEVTFDRAGNGSLTTGTFDVTYQPLREVDGAVSGILSIAVETTAFVAERRRLERDASAS